jgi:hypothetical protein
MNGKQKFIPNQRVRLHSTNSLKSNAIDPTPAEFRPGDAIRHRCNNATHHDPFGRNLTTNAPSAWGRLDGCNAAIGAGHRIGVNR